MVGKWSSQVTHNGLLIRDQKGDRGDPIQAIHAEQDRGLMPAEPVQMTGLLSHHPNGVTRAGSGGASMSG